MDKIDACIRGITHDELPRMPQADRQRLAMRMREFANMLDPEPAAPLRVLEAFGALKASDFETMYPLDRAGFAAACRRWAHVADPRRDFHKGGVCSDPPEEA